MPPFLHHEAGVLTAQWLQVVDTIPIRDFGTNETVKPIKAYCYSWGGACKIQVALTTTGTKISVESLSMLLVWFARCAMQLAFTRSVANKLYIYTIYKQYLYLYIYITR